MILCRVFYWSLSADISSAMSFFVQHFALQYIRSFLMQATKPCMLATHSPDGRLNRAYKSFACLAKSHPLHISIFQKIHMQHIMSLQFTILQAINTLLQNLEMNSPDKILTRAYSTGLVMLCILYITSHIDSLILPDHFSHFYIWWW